MSTLERGVIVAYAAGTHTATVQFARGLADSVSLPVSVGIAPADVVAGRECGVIFFTDDNPADASIVTIHNAVPAAVGGGHTIRENGTDQTARTGLNIVDTDAGAGLVTDDAGGNETEVNLNLYPLKNGRAAGQTIIGGAAGASNKRLKLQGTFDAVGELGNPVQVLDMLALPRLPSYPGNLSSGEAGLWQDSVDYLPKITFRSPTVAATFVPGAASGALYAPGLEGRAIPYPGGLSLSGLLSTIVETSPGAAAASTLDASGHYRTETTNAAIGSVAGTDTVSALTQASVIGDTIQCIMLIPTITSIRVFAGWTDQPLATMLAGDNPAGNYFGYQFSTGRGDANWQCVTKDGTTQVVTNSAIPMTAADWWTVRLGQFPGINPVAALLTFTAGGGPGFTPKFIKLINVSPPTAGTAMRFVMGIAALANSTRTLRWKYKATVSEHPF